MPMKKFKTILFALMFIILICGCRKNYSCACDNVAIQKGVIGNGAGVYPVAAYSKSRAQEKCSEKSTYIPNTNPKEYDVYCALK